MTIGKKIGAGYGIALLFVAIMSSLFYRTSSQLVDTNEMVTHTLKVLESLEKVLSLMKDSETGQRGFLVTQDPKFLQPYVESEKVLDKALHDLRELLDDNETQKKNFGELNKLIADRRDYNRTTLNFRTEKGAEAEKGRADAIALEKTSLGKDLMDQIRVKVEGMQSIEKDLLKTRQRASDANVAFSNFTILASTTLAIAIVGLIGFFTVRSINTTVGNGVGQLTSASAEILATTTQQAAGAQEQAAAVTQTMTTVDEVSQTADQGAQRAKTIGEAVQRTLEIGRTGRKVVDDSLVAMESVKEKVETTAQNILMLAEQAQAISDIIATVNDIAEQSNLLALNAAIEASRAGEHGRGFTVVAGEVKTLADQSKKATGQVRQILGEIQKATNTAVLSTEEVTKGVAGAIKVGGQAGETIKTLADTLNETSHAVRQIAASAAQQATGMNQINQAMKNIDQVAKQNTVATRQATQAAENLNQLGLQLAAFIGK